VIISQCKNPD